MPLTIYIPFGFLILASLIISILTEQDKKEDYLSVSLDLSFMLLVFHWKGLGLARIAILIVITVAVYLTLVYLLILRPNKKNNYKDLPSHRSNAQRYLGGFCLLPIIITSDWMMIILLGIYIITERVLFYKRHHS